MEFWGLIGFIFSPITFALIDFIIKVYLKQNREQLFDQAGHFFDVRSEKLKEYVEKTESIALIPIYDLDPVYVETLLSLSSIRTRMSAEKAGLIFADGRRHLLQSWLRYGSDAESLARWIEEDLLFFYLEREGIRGFDSDVLTHQVASAVWDSLTNAIVHGNKFLANKPFIVTWDFKSQQDMTFRIYDLAIDKNSDDFNIRHKSHWISRYLGFSGQGLGFSRAQKYAAVTYNIVYDQKQQQVGAVTTLKRSWQGWKEALHRTFQWMGWESDDKTEHPNKPSSDISSSPVNGDYHAAPIWITEIDNDNIAFIKKVIRDDFKRLTDRLDIDRAFSILDHVKPIRNRPYTMVEMFVIEDLGGGKASLSSPVQDIYDFGDDLMGLGDPRAKEPDDFRDDPLITETEAKAKKSRGKPKRRGKNDRYGIKPGVRIRHVGKRTTDQMFGQGTVVSINDQYITVDFDKHGQKKLSMKWLAVLKEAAVNFIVSGLKNGKEPSNSEVMDKFKISRERAQRYQREAKRRIADLTSPAKNSSPVKVKNRPAIWARIRQLKQRIWSAIYFSVSQKLLDWSLGALTEKEKDRSVLNEDASDELAQENILEQYRRILEDDFSGQEDGWRASSPVKRDIVTPVIYIGVALGLMAAGRQWLHALDPYLSAAIKFAVLAPIGKYLGNALKTRNWKMDLKAMFWKMAYWALMGVMIKFAFVSYVALANFVLGADIARTIWAGFISVTMNLTFGMFMLIAMSALFEVYGAHRSYSLRRLLSKEILPSTEEWKIFTSLMNPKVVWEKLKTAFTDEGLITKLVREPQRSMIWWWIPAHTVTFSLSDPRAQITLAAIWSVVLGIFLGLGEMQKRSHRLDSIRNEGTDGKASSPVRQNGQKLFGLLIAGTIMTVILTSAFLAMTTPERTADVMLASFTQQEDNGSLLDHLMDGIDWYFEQWRGVEGSGLFPFILITGVLMVILMALPALALFAAAALLSESGRMITSIKQRGYGGFWRQYGQKFKHTAVRISKKLLRVRQPNPWVPLTDMIAKHVGTEEKALKADISKVEGGVLINGASADEIRVWARKYGLDIGQMLPDQFYYINGKWQRVIYQVYLNPDYPLKYRMPEEEGPATMDFNVFKALLTGYGDNLDQKRGELDRLDPAWKQEAIRIDVKLTDRFAAGLARAAKAVWYKQRNKELRAQPGRIYFFRKSTDGSMAEGIIEQLVIRPRPQPEAVSEIAQGIKQRIEKLRANWDMAAWFLTYSLFAFLIYDVYLTGWLVHLAVAFQVAWLYFAARYNGLPDFAEQLSCARTAVMAVIFAAGFEALQAIPGLTREHVFEWGDIIPTALGFMLFGFVRRLYQHWDERRLWESEVLDATALIKGMHKAEALGKGLLSEFRTGKQPRRLLVIGREYWQRVLRAVRSRYERMHNVVERLELGRRTQEMRRHMQHETEWHEIQFDLRYREGIDSLRSVRRWLLVRQARMKMVWEAADRLYAQWKEIKRDQRTLSKRSADRDKASSPVIFSSAAGEERLIMPQKGHNWPLNKNEYLILTHPHPHHLEIYNRILPAFEKKLGLHSKISQPPLTIDSLEMAGSFVGEYDVPADLGSSAFFMGGAVSGCLARTIKISANDTFSKGGGEFTARIISQGAWLLRMLKVYALEDYFTRLKTSRFNRFSKLSLDDRIVLFTEQLLRNGFIKDTAFALPKNIVVTGIVDGRKFQVFERLSGDYHLKVEIIRPGDFPHPSSSPVEDPGSQSMRLADVILGPEKDELFEEVFDLQLLYDHGMHMAPSTSIASLLNVVIESEPSFRALEIAFSARPEADIFKQKGDFPINGASLCELAGEDDSTGGPNPRLTIRLWAREKKGALRARNYILNGFQEINRRPETDRCHFGVYDSKSSSPVQIDKERWAWGVQAVPGRPVVPMRDRIEVAIVPFVDERVVEKVKYLFQRARSFWERFCNYLMAFWEMLRDLLDAVLPQRMIVLAAPHIIVNQPRHSERSEESYTLNSRSFVASAPQDDGLQNPVGAVMAASTSSKRTISGLGSHRAAQAVICSFSAASHGLSGIGGTGMPAYAAQCAIV